MMGEYLRSLNVGPTYLQQKNSNFAEMRRRLNSEPGVVISNHPGHLDTPVILNMLSRTDIKVLAGTSARTRLSPILGASNIIDATSDRSKLLGQFREVKSFIERGGLFLMYPAGGTETFQHGFRLLVDKILRPTDMVYACHVEADDITALADERKSRMVGAVSNIVLPGNQDINAKKERKYIRVNEHYTQAEEWKKVLMKANDKKGADILLTEHFVQLFDKQEQSPEF